MAQKPDPAPPQPPPEVPPEPERPAPGPPPERPPAPPPDMPPEPERPPSPEPPPVEIPEPEANGGAGPAPALDARCARRWSPPWPRQTPDSARATCIVLARLADAEQKRTHASMPRRAQGIARRIAAARRCRSSSRRRGPGLAPRRGCAWPRLASAGVAVGALVGALGAVQADVDEVGGDLERRAAGRRTRRGRARRCAGAQQLAEISGS